MRKDMRICMEHPLETVSKQYTVKIVNPSDPKGKPLETFSKTAEFVLPVPLGIKSTQSRCQQLQSPKAQEKFDNYSTLLLWILRSVMRQSVMSV